MDAFTLYASSTACGIVGFLFLVLSCQVVTNGQFEREWDVTVKASCNYNSTVAHNHFKPAVGCFYR